MAKDLDEVLHDNPEEFATANGFTNAAEMHRLITEVDLTEKMAEFLAWRDDDGTKDGLVQLLTGEIHQLSDERMGMCGRCMQFVEKEELRSEPGALLIVVSEEVTGIVGRDLRPGYYRVLRWPFYMSNMVGSGYFLPGEMQRVADLDEDGKASAEQIGYSYAPLCKECQKAVESTNR